MTGEKESLTEKEREDLAFIRRRASNLVAERLESALIEARKDVSEVEAERDKYREALERGAKGNGLFKSACTEVLSDE